MEVFGIGPLEFLLIFVIVLLVLGPKDIEKTARNLGKSLNKLYRSQNYQVIRKASEEIRNLPARLAAEAQLDELKEMTDFKDLQQDLTDTVKEINTAATDPMKAWTEEHNQVEKEIKAEVKAEIKSASNGATTANKPPAIVGGAPPVVENSIAPPNAGQATAAPATVTSIPADAPAAAPTAPNSADGPKQ
jgi:Sec-independent protein translocase protein TatA